MIQRKTVQRTLILDAVKKLQCHATADEIYEEVQKNCPSISRATVYRNLQQCCENGDIRRREVPGSPDRYDHDTSNHYHVRCKICGKVADIGMPYLTDIAGRIEDNHGFIVESHDIIFTGVCPDCRNKSNQSLN